MFLGALQGGVLQPQSSGHMSSGTAMQTQLSEHAIYVSPNDSMLLSSRRSATANFFGANGGQAYDSSAVQSRDGRGSRAGSATNSGVNPTGPSMRDSETSGKQDGSRRDSAQGIVSTASSGHAQVRPHALLIFSSIRREQYMCSTER